MTLYLKAVTLWFMLDVVDVTASGYQLYDPGMIDRIKKTHKLKQARYTLSEIKKNLKKQGF